MLYYNQALRHFNKTWGTEYAVENTRHDNLERNHITIFVPALSIDNLHNSLGYPLSFYAVCCWYVRLHSILLQSLLRYPQID